MGGLFNRVFDGFFSFFFGGIVGSVEDVIDFLTISGDLLNIFAWVKVFLPMNLIGILFALTTGYYSIRAIFALIKIIKAGVVGENGLGSMLKNI